MFERLRVYLFVHALIAFFVPQVGDVWTHVTGHHATRLNLLPLRLDDADDSDDSDDSDNSDSDSDSDNNNNDSDDSEERAKKQIMKERKRARQEKKRLQAANKPRVLKFKGRDRLWTRVRTIRIVVASVS